MQLIFRKRNLLILGIFLYCFLLAACSSSKPAVKATVPAAGNTPAVTKAPAAKLLPGNWRQWRGPRADGISPEKILLDWPDNGPQQLWQKAPGTGFSGISVDGGKLYTMYADGSDEYLSCMDVLSGEEVWRQRTGAHYRDRQGGDGPRTTPVIEGDRVVTMSAYGTLYAFNKKDGSLIWKKDLPAEFGARMPRWGFSATPLIDKGLVLLDVGGRSGYSAMAFKLSDGSVAWHGGNDNPGYSSPVTVATGGVEQALFFTGTKLTAVSAKNGKVLWEYPWRTSYYVNVATPIILPGDRVFISSNYDYGAAVLQMTANGSQVSVKPLWENKSMRNHMATSIFYNGYVYGFDNGTLACVDVESGETQWKKRGFGKGTLVLADGHLVVLGERGQLVLAKAEPNAYREVANAGQVINGRCWTVPTIAGGKLFLRSLKEIVCLDISRPSS